MKETQDQDTNVTVMGHVLYSYIWVQASTNPQKSKSKHTLCVCVCRRTCICAHTCTHMHTHIHTHTYTGILSKHSSLKMNRFSRKACAFPQEMWNVHFPPRWIGTAAEQKCKTQIIAPEGPGGWPRWLPLRRSSQGAKAWVQRPQMSIGFYCTNFCITVHTTSRLLYFGINMGSCLYEYQNVENVLGQT